MILIMDEELEKDFYDMLSETAHKSDKPDVISKIQRLTGSVEMDKLSDDIFYKLVPVLINELWDIRREDTPRAQAITLAILTYLILIENKDNINSLKGIYEVSAQSLVLRNYERFMNKMLQRLEDPFASRTERLTLAKAIENIKGIRNEEK